MKNSAKEKRVTIADIARKAGVSTSAVSSLLNNRNNGIRLSAETQKRIIDTCRLLKYQPQGEHAQRLLYPQEGNICFLINSTSPRGIQHQYFGQILSGIISTFEDPTQPITYSLFDPYLDYEAEPEKLPQPLRNGTATRFIAASVPNPSLVRMALKAGLPFVYAGHVLEIPHLTCVVPDYREAMVQAVKYLSNLGHKRIAYLTGPLGAGLYNMIEMEKGFAEGLREVGLPLHPQYIYHCESELGEFPRKNLEVAANHLMKLDPPPTAILCFHDPAAITVSACLQSQGYRIPEDVSIMGCNDQPEAATHHPALTTIHFPLHEMGRRAVQEIDKQITLGPPEATDVIKLPIKLIKRNSCGAPKED